MNTNVKYENISDSYVEFRSGIEKNDGKFCEVRENFLGEPKNKDHVSCFSIWGEDDSEFFQIPKPI